jgi:hypothetical protein
MVKVQKSMGEKAFKTSQSIREGEKNLLHSFRVWFVSSPLVWSVGCIFPTRFECVFPQGKSNLNRMSQEAAKVRGQAFDGVRKTMGASEQVYTRNEWKR